MYYCHWEHSLICCAWGVFGKVDCEFSHLIQTEGGFKTFGFPMNIESFKFANNLLVYQMLWVHEIGNSALEV